MMILKAIGGDMDHKSDSIYHCLIANMIEGFVVAGLLILLKTIGYRSMDIKVRLNEGAMSTYQIGETIGREVDGRNRRTIGGINLTIHIHLTMIVIGG